MTGDVVDLFNAPNLVSLLECHVIAVRSITPKIPFYYKNQEQQLTIFGAFSFIEYSLLPWFNFFARK